MTHSSEQWLPDPTGRHSERLLSAGAWTDRVRDHGVVNRDPLGVPMAPGSPAGAPDPRRSGAAFDAAPTVATKPSADRSNSRLLPAAGAVVALLVVGAFLAGRSSAPGTAVGVDGVVVNDSIRLADRRSETVDFIDGTVAAFAEDGCLVVELDEIALVFTPDGLDDPEVCEDLQADFDEGYESPDSDYKFDTVGSSISGSSN